MTISDVTETDILKLYFNAVSIANLADNAAASPVSTVYVGLHTADPGDAGTQSTSECTYGTYARVGVPRTPGGWTVSGSIVSPVANITFPTATSGTATVTHWSIGTASAGAGTLWWSGTVTPNINVAVGVTPILTTASTIQLD
jgi:hypothetical protein